MRLHLLLAAVLAVFALPAWAHGDAQAHAHAPVQPATAAPAPARALAPAPVVTATAGSWPRLFFAPEERRLVTQLRQAALDGGRAVADAGSEAGASMPVAGRPGAPRVDGISLVRGARYAAWIGGRRVEDGGHWDGYRLRITRNGVEFIDAAGGARLVKVGQPVSQRQSPVVRPAP